MTACMSIGSAGKLAVEDSGDSPRTFNNASERYDFLYETMTQKQRRVGNRTIKGDLSNWEERNVEGASFCSGVIAFNANAAWFNNWMPRIIGTTTDGNNGDGDPIYVPDTSLPSFDLLIYKEAKTFHFYDCYVNRCLIRGESAPSEEEPEVIDVVVQLIAKQRVTTTTWPNPEPVIPTSESARPFVMGHSTLTVGGTDYPFDKFTLSIDHNLITKFRNSLTLSCIRPGMRSVRLQTNNPFLTASFDALHNTLSSPPTGLLKLIRGGSYAEFTFAALDNLGEDPSIRGKSEIIHSLDFQALRDASDDEPEIKGSTTIAP